MKMELQYSILLFSKYSPQCKKFIDMISNSGVNFSNLKSVCIDNEQVRKRVLSNKQFNIKIVPSVLLIYSNGNVETYEGVNAFNWAGGIIQQFSPPPQQVPPQQQYQSLPPQQQYQSPPPQQQQQYQSPPPPQQQRQRSQPPRRQTPVMDQDQDQDQEPEEEQEDNYRKVTASLPIHRKDPKGLGEDIQDNTDQMSPSQINELEKSIENRGDKNTSTTKVKTRPKMISRDEVKATDIDSIPFENDENDDEENDRHRTVKPPRRIRQDEANYEEDNTLFSGEIIENRKQPVNTVKQKAQKSTKENLNMKSKADALALEREELEKQINKPVSRSESEFRRP
jgi:hypothetical protein